MKVQDYWSMLWGTTKLLMMLVVTNLVLFSQETGNIQNVYKQCVRFSSF